MLFSLTAADRAPEGDKVKVTLDYSAFAKAYGGDWASRLRLVRLPECALTTPDSPECRTPVPLESVNEPARGAVSASVDAPAARPAEAKGFSLAAASGPAGGPTVLAALADAAGPTGDYKATQLQASGSWSAGGSTGTFTWAYPMAAPPVPGGLQPAVSLGYSSQAVDGRSSASNNQAGWLGDGWSYEPGFIERRYKPCDDDKTGGTNTAKVGDLCWFNDNAVLNLGGKNTELVYEAGKGWHPAADSGEKVEKLTGAANGDNDGEHWKITSTDGTQYFFGLNRLPGFQPGSAETRSTWTVPVFGNQSGEPCYNASFANAWCQQAWRWQLDYVVDARGNAMAYYWNTETNNYARNWSTTTGKGTATPYVRGGWLDRVEYGLRADTVYSAKPMGVVKFDVDERCLADCGTFDEAHAKNWPDVPFDLYCADGADCKSNASPTFWSRKRLVTVTARALTGGTHKDVDSWSLKQGFPPSGDGLSTPMWLSSVTRTGWTGGKLELPPVTFDGEQMANRVDRTGDGLAPFVRLRMSQITSETGGTTGVYYSQPGCTATSLPAANGSNTSRCYPVKRREGSTVKDDWFNSYVVEKVVEGDNLAETPDKVTEYSYPDGAAWAMNEDELTNADERTFSVARGYGRVQTRTGAGYDARTLTETRYFRGIDGAAVKDSAGEAVTDRPEFAGQLRERAVYNGDGGALVSATSYTPWISTATATRNRAGLPALTARFSGVQKEQTRTAVTGGERRTSLSRTFDEYGLLSTLSELGDESRSGDERCTTTTYARNTGTWMLNRPSRVELVGAACGAPVNRPADVITDTQTLYDNTTTVGAAPTAGLATESRGINGAGNGYDTLSRTGYDAYGRVVSATDTYGRTTTTAYTPAAGEVAASSVVTNPLGHTTTTGYEPLRGQALTISDPNAKVTTSRFDALGRLTGVWLPTRSAATYPDSPNYGFDYQVRNNGPVVVTTRTLQFDSTYETSYAIYDGLMRSRQTQRTSPDRTGRLVTEQFYDSRGLAWRDSGSYYADGAAEGVLVTGQELKYPSSTDTLYDGAARPTAVIGKRFGDETKRTTTTYHGDGITVVPPKGGTAKTNLADARGNVVEMKEYTNEERTASQSVLYRYDQRGQVVEMTDPVGNVWRYGYDSRGRQVRVEDPDKGTSELTVDVGGRVTDVKDARGVVLHTDYDALGRTTAVKQGATKLAEWTYDTAAKGKPDTSTRYVNGAAYVSAVTSYNALYQPVNTQLTVPSAEGQLANTYKWTTSYYPNTGQPMWTQQPALGGLPAERVVHSYTPTTGLPVSTYAGGAPIVSVSTYDHYGRTLRDEYGAFGSHLWASYEYDEHTGSLLRAVSDREAAPQRIDDTHYTYDAVGNVTSTSTRSGQDAPVATDTQCVITDSLRRITQAWTATDNCAAAPSASTVGGPDAYWTSFGYDGVGNRRSETRHGLGGAADTVRTYTPVQGKPNALAEVTQTGPGGTVKESYSYDVTGNTTGRTIGSAPAQTLEWDQQGHLAKLTGTGTDNTYVYDADGGRLVRRDSTGTTLYLPGGNELKLAPGATTPVGTRYYSHGGRTAAVRTAGKLSFVLADQHGTATVHVDSATQAVTRRKTTLFGAERGTAPGSGWLGDHGFLGGTRDGDTGLTHLGAREYDPNTGRFISVDPQMDTTASQEMGAYTYANNNPLTTSDPSGEALPECYSGQYTCTNKGTQPVDYGSNYLNITRNQGGTPAPEYCATHDCSPPPPTPPTPRSNSKGNLTKDERKARANHLGDQDQKKVEYRAVTEEQRKEMNRSFSFTMNDAELSLCWDNKSDCTVYVAESMWAMRENQYKEGGQGGAEANAYRHVLWQASLTARLGREKAEKWAAAHEAYYPPEEETDHRVDLLNNEFAQALGERAAREANGNKAVTVLLIKRGAREYLESDSYARKSDLE
ncbi:RHS repeat-associated core domain-containing protein [Kitasatospora sp. NPDC057541]|uniref:RHS repeat domain-containing protein n=1 Tax=unclassified Kitasatospora TaxID=2633591 RepID=UPI0036991F33